MKNTHVEVIEADATTAMTFPDGSLSAVLSFTMLHHVSSSTIGFLIRCNMGTRIEAIQCTTSAEILNGPTTPSEQRMQLLNSLSSEVGPGQAVTWAEAMADGGEELRFQMEAQIPIISLGVPILLSSCFTCCDSGYSKQHNRRER